MNVEWASWIASAVQWGVAGAVLLLPLVWLWPAPQFRISRRAVMMGASLFWPAFAVCMLQLAWAGYYQFFYPAWMKWGVVIISFVVYPAYAGAAHWLVVRLPGHPLPWFCLAAGLLAAAEHVLAWGLVDLPNRVPYLRGAPLPAVMLFAFFEYQVYWGAALWLGWALIQVAHWRVPRAAAMTR
jgi:hypothetical protein